MLISINFRRIILVDIASIGPQSPQKTKCRAKKSLLIARVYISGSTKDVIRGGSGEKQAEMPITNG